MQRRRSRNLFRHDNTPKTLRFRVSLLETLETRIVMAVDVTTIVQDLANASLQHNGALIGPTSASLRTNTNNIVDLTDKELPPELQRMVNGALRYRNISVDQSGTAQQFSRKPDKSNLVQNRLMQSPFVIPPDLNSRPRTVSSQSSLDGSSKHAISFTNPSTQSLSAMASRTAASLNAKASPTTEIRNSSASGLGVESVVQWVGAHCNTFGHAIHPQASLQMQTVSGGEGEGEEVSYFESLVPEVEFPELEFTEYTGSLADFVPSQQASISDITTFGAFTPASLTNPDFTLPGVHWVRQIDQTWTSSTVWSLTETMVISFRLSDSDSTTDSESTTNRELLAELEEELPDESEQDLELEIDTETDTTAFRVGFYILVFHASRGVTSPASAGVKWNFQEEFSDSIVLGIDQTVDVGYSPETYDPDTHVDGESFPSDFVGDMTNESSVTITVAASGETSFFSTPSINSGSDVQRNVSAIVSYANSGSVNSSETWLDSNSSGNLQFVSQTPGSPQSLHDVNAGLFPPASFPTDRSDFADEYFIDFDVEPPTAGSIIELSALDGVGSLSASNGFSTSSQAGANSGSISLLATLDNGELTSLVGNSTSSLAAAKQASGNASGTFLFKDSVEESTPIGPETTTIVLLAGWKGQLSEDGDVAGGLDVDSALVDDEIQFLFEELTGLQEANVDGDSGIGVEDFLAIELFSEVSNSYDSVITDQFGDHAVIGSLNKSNLITYVQQNAGTSLGDLEGIVNLSEIDSGVDSNLKGYSREVLKQIYNEDWESSDTLVDTQQLLYGGEATINNAEKLTSQSAIDGTVTVFRSDDDAVDVNLDATVISKLSVEYSDAEDLYEFIDFVGCTLACSMEYDWTREAELEGALTKTSSITGTASIDPDSEAGDSGGFTTSDVLEYAGDVETAITVTGVHDGQPEEKTQREIELEKLLGVWEEPEEPEGGNGGSGGGGFTPGVIESETTYWGVGSQFFKGIGQGGLNLLNGLTPIFIQTNPAFTAVAQFEDLMYSAAGIPENQQIRPLEIVQQDWSRGVLTEEYGTPGT